MRKYNIFQKLLSVLSVVVLSANFIGINVEAAETNNVENAEYHVVGTLFDEEYTLDENMLIYIDPNLPKEENGLARKPGTGVYLFTIEDFWTGRMTRVYEYGYAVNQKFIQYLSSVWAKRSQYTENQTQTVSWSMSSNISLDIADGVKTQFGYSTSVTSSLGIGSVIPADPTQFSKLALYADFHDYRLKCNILEADYTYIESYYGDVSFPTGDLYYIVEYQ